MLFIFPFLLTSITVSLVSTETTTAREVNLPIPRIYGTSHDIDGEDYINWITEDETVDESVLGYKVKLWHVGCAKQPKYTTVDGQQVRLKHVMPKFDDNSTLRNLTEFTVEGVDNTRLLTRDMELDVPYHMTVAAYGEAGEGSPSRPFRIQFGGRFTCREI